MSAPDLVVAGNLLIDDIVLPDGSTLMGEAGGAVLYASLAAALWGVKVGVLSVRGDDYPQHALDALAARGIDLTGVRTIAGPGLRTWLLYERLGRRVVHQLGCPSHEQVSPRVEDLPSDWRSVPAFHVAPMPFAIQAPLVRILCQAMPSTLFSIDPHEPITESNLEEWRDLVAKVGAVFVSEDELKLPGVATSPISALGRLAFGKLRGTAAVRLGARGGALMDLNPESFGASTWPGTTEGVVDTTGAGDAFAAGFLAGRLRGEPLDRCCAMGAVSATFAIAARGTAGLLAATPDDAVRRLAAYESTRDDDARTVPQ